jgi:type IV secretory pathway protease TraF
MVGLNSLFKLFRKTFAPKFEGRGFLPRRYYLHRALEALDEDDIDEAVRMITLAGQDKKKSARWRLVWTEDIRNLYLRLQKVERKARDILKNYELRLLEQLSDSTASVAQPS